MELALDMAARSGLPGIIAKYGIGWYLLIPIGILAVISFLVVRADERHEKQKADD